ncbi:MAG TPA: hypothetical protein VJY54_12560 [Lachnospiraceae bacterium]|nr:hypothetical protein [Lachnospiraceae bacterium]
MNDKKKIYWHLPGFCYYRVMNQIMINFMRDYPEKFFDGYQIGSVYGTFPGAIWNGGRTVFGITSKRDMSVIINMYNNFGVPVRFTWTNSLLEEKHLNDTYCNLIMLLADNGQNQVLINTPVLEEYIRIQYPSFKRISSTTKRIVDLKALSEELEKDYYLVVLDYDMNHNEEILKSIQPHADRVEILVNEICYPNCPKRTEHYNQQSKAQLEFDAHSTFPCPNRTKERKFSECINKPAFISNEMIGSYIDKGFINFKIVGRGMPAEYLKESYLYFLVKPEHRAFVGQKIDSLLSHAQNCATSPRKN